MNKSFLSLCAIIILFLFSCKKDDFITSPNARLNITDSVKFDTVFATTGSVTKSFKIFNDNNQKILISKIRLMGGSSSSFRINVNGFPVNEVNDIEIAPNDSIYVFVSVTIDPTAANQPFIVSDSILVNYNTNIRYVQLQAYGQNAVFLQSQLITGNVTWSNTRPFVILGGIRVDTTAVLTISAGTKVYMHADAPFIVDGTLLVNGTKNEKVIFAGDRIDDPYRDFPASWPGIFIRNSSTNSTFTFAVIKNAYQAVITTGPSLNANPKLLLQQVIIDNAYDAGLLCINSNVSVNNSLISNCGSNVVIQAGGIYNFTHCTVASYATQFLSHTRPVLIASSFGLVNGSPVNADLDALFRNCIFWGDNNTLANEVQIYKQGSNLFNVTLDHCLYKAADDPANTTLLSVIKNVDPSFDTINYGNNFYDFRVTKNLLAPGTDQGVLTSFPIDLDGNPRNVIIPDLGAYEKQ